MNKKEYWVIATFDDNPTTWCKRFEATDLTDLFNQIDGEFDVRQHNQFIVLNKKQAEQVRRDLNKFYFLR